MCLPFTVALNFSNPLMFSYPQVHDTLDATKTFVTSINTGFKSASWFPYKAAREMCFKIKKAWQWITSILLNYGSCWGWGGEPTLRRKKTFCRSTFHFLSFNESSYTKGIQNTFSKATNQQTQITHSEYFQDPQKSNHSLIALNLGQQLLYQTKLESIKDINHGFYIWIRNF